MDLETMINEKREEMRNTIIANITNVKGYMQHYNKVTYKVDGTKIKLKENFKYSLFIFKLDTVMVANEAEKYFSEVKITDETDKRIFLENLLELISYNLLLYGDASRESNIDSEFLQKQHLKCINDIYNYLIELSTYLDINVNKGDLLVFVTDIMEKFVKYLHRSIKMNIGDHIKHLVSINNLDKVKMFLNNTAVAYDFISPNYISFIIVETK